MGEAKRRKALGLPPKVVKRQPISKKKERAIIDEMTEFNPIVTAMALLMGARQRNRNNFLRMQREVDQEVGST